MVQDKKTRSSFIYWLPRILAILFIGFFGLFALDVFGMEGSLFEQIGGFFIHLIPNFVLLIFLLIAWRKEKIGGVLFLFAGILFMYLFVQEGEWMGFLIISFPLFLIGVLFLLNDYVMRRT